MKSLLKPHIAAQPKNQKEYLIHFDGTVTKFTHGVEDLSKHNRVYIVGKISKRFTDIYLDSSQYNGYNPVICNLIKSEEKGFYLFEI